MKKIILLLTIGFVLVACSGEETVSVSIASDETLSLGKQVYDASCASCHGVNGEGQNPEAPLQRDETGRYLAPPHDETGHTWHHDDDLLVQIIKEGGMGDPETFYPMPAFWRSVDG